MELSRLCAAHPDNGDLIEATPLVKRADFHRRSYLISREFVESKKCARLLEKVISLGGNWERNFGGYLILYLPRAVAFEQVESEF